MRAWLMDSYEGTEKLRLGEVQDPEPGPGQVLLRVRLAALNPADAFLAQAMYPARPPLPHILGRDGVGDVTAVGPGVDNALMGQTLGVLRSSVGVEAWGTLAEKVVVPAVDLVPVPQAWSLEENGWRSFSLPHCLAGADAMGRPANAASRGFGAARDWRLRGRRRGFGAAWEIDESYRGGSVS